MNGTYYANPTFPNAINDNDIIIDESNNNLSLNNLLKKNKGKKINVFMSFSNTNEIKELNGRLENIYDDYFIINDIESDEYKIILFKYLDYISFNEKIITT